MKKILAIALFVIMLTPLRANAFDWGSFFRWFFFGGETVQALTTDEINTTVKDINEQVKTLDNSVQTDFLAVVPYLTTQKDATNFESEFKKINASNAKDSDEQILKIISDYTTTIKSNKVGVLLILKTSSDIDKTALASKVKLLSENAQKYNELYKKGYNLTSKVTTTDDKEQTSAIENLNKTTESVKNKAEVIYAFASQVKTLASLAGIK